MSSISSRFIFTIWDLRPFLATKLAIKVILIKALPIIAAIILIILIASFLTYLLKQQNTENLTYGGINSLYSALDVIDVSELVTVNGTPQDGYSLAFVEDIDEKLFNKYLYQELPPIDYLIRTSGELRISNFMLWQISYAEFYFPNTYFPDFNEEEFDKAIVEYTKRDRRFGKIDYNKK